MNYGLITLELEKKKHRKTKLSTCFQAVTNGLEARKPSRLKSVPKIFQLPMSVLYMAGKTKPEGEGLEYVTGLGQKTKITF